MDPMERITAVNAECQTRAAPHPRIDIGEETAPAATADRAVRAAFIDSVARDVARPIALISGATADLKKRCATDPAARALIAMVDEQLGHLEMFAALLADLAKLECHAIDVRRKNINLSAVVDLVGEDAAFAARGRNVEFRLPPDTLFLRVDPAILHKVLTLLITNASRQSPLGSTIVVQAGKLAGFVRLQVMDEGDGIDPQRLAMLFDQYRLPCRDHENGFDGDLRLALCRAFVEATGGTITASNRTDRTGAVFTIAFAEGP